MAATNSTNKILSGDSQNCDVTLSGQPADKNLSVKVSAAHTVKYTPNTSNVSLVSQTQSQVLKDSNNVPYRTDSAQYSWKHNRNTQGSIDGTISIKASRNASYKGELYGNGLYVDSGLPLNISGIKYVATSDQRSEREDNVKITCTVPISASTNDLHGGTYSFTSDMNGKTGWDTNIRGMFQTYYNEEEPEGHLTISRNRVTLSRHEYSDGKWKDEDYKTPGTPGIYVESNMPSIKYGDAKGKLDITQQTTSSSTPSQCIYSFISDSLFNTTASDKSNSSVPARDLIYDYVFDRFNSKNGVTDSGTFKVHQEGGKINPLDPEISYTWTLTPVDKTESIGQYVKFNKYTSTYQGKKDDGNYQTFSYTMKADVVPLSSMDGRKGSLNGTIVFGNLDTDVRGNSLSSSKIVFTNGERTSDRDYKVTCDVSTNYVTNNTITPRSVDKIFTVSGAKWTINPQFTIRLTASYVNGKGDLATNLPQIPGTSNYPSIMLSSDNKNWSSMSNAMTSIEYTIKSGTWSTTNTTIDLSHYKTYVKLSDNSPRDNNGGGNSGYFKCDISLDNSADASKLTYTSVGGVIKIEPSQLSISPSMHSSFPAIKWCVVATIINKTRDCTGTVSLDPNTVTRYITQKEVKATVSSYEDAKASITLPSFCEWKSGSNDTLTWTKDDVTSTHYAYFKVNKYTIDDFSWWISQSNKKYMFVSSGSNPRSGNVTITLPSGTSLKNGIRTLKITQNPQSIYGKIKVESCTGFTGISTGDLLDWNNSFSMNTPSPNSPTYNYTASMTIQSGVTNNQISPNGTTITGTITTGGSASDGKSISCSAKFVLTGTNNDNANYRNSDTEKGYHIETATVSGESATLEATDYDVRCTYDNGKKSCTVNVDKSRGTFSIKIDSNKSSSAYVSNVSWVDPLSKHDNDMLSKPYIVTVNKGKGVASTKTYKLEICPAGGSWQTCYTLTQPAGQEGSSNTSATQTFEVVESKNCTVTPHDFTVNWTSTNNDDNGPKVDIDPSNSSDGTRRVTSLDSIDGNPTIRTEFWVVAPKNYELSFFSINEDNKYPFSIEVLSDNYYFGASNEEAYFTFDYSGKIRPTGNDYKDMISGYLHSSKLGRLIGTRIQYSLDNQNWTNITKTGRTEEWVNFKSSEINVRSTSDKKYTKTIYVRLIDSAGNVLKSTSDYVALTVNKVEYYNS